MKKAILILAALLFAVCVNGQNHWGGFFKPADQVMQKPTKFGEAIGTNWLFRPAVLLTAVAVQFGGGEPVTYSLNSVGFGIGYGKFSIVNDNAYCNYSVNLSLLTQVELSGVFSTTLGGALTIDVFNKIIGIGCGYLDKHVMLLTTISYSF